MIMAGANRKAINSWHGFAKYVRSLGCGRQLQFLEQYDMPILVAGCQRSGTTMVERILSSHEAIQDHGFSKDEELDAALILSGCVPFETNSRVCFQTTYLDNCYTEYFDHAGKFKLIWLVRRPESIVYSMMYNWRGSALNRLFAATGSTLLDDRDAKWYRRFGPIAIPKLRKACLSYNAKSLQAIELKQRLSPFTCFVDYDSLVHDPVAQLKRVFDFVGLEFDASLAERVSPGSISKADRLSARERRFIEETCGLVYERIRVSVL